MALRRILHVDMDAFYASVEQRDDATIRGRPVAVGGKTGRSVVAAASYEARKFGVKSAMPMSRALRLCPELVVVKPDFDKYSEVSDQIFTLFREVTPLVEGLSLDEAYLDVTENAWGIPLGVDVARRIKAEIVARTRLTASAGVAPNKFLAKIASGWKKPDGLTVIAPERVDAFLEKLPVDALWGVGPVTAKKLRALGLEKLVDVRKADLEKLRQAVGSWAEGLIELAHGIDEDPVEPHYERKSVGSEETYEHDLTEIGTIREEIDQLARGTAEWLASHGRKIRTVTIKVRYENFETITRSETRQPPTDIADEIAARAVALLDKTEAGTRPVRLLGVSLHGFHDESETLEEPKQLSFKFEPL